MVPYVSASVIRIRPGVSPINFHIYSLLVELIGQPVQPMIFLNNYNLLIYNLKAQNIIYCDILDTYNMTIPRSCKLIKTVKKNIFS